MALKRVRWVLAILCLAVMLVGCQAGVPKTHKALPEWSRGQQLGVTSLNVAVSMCAENDALHMLWVAAQGKVLHYVRLDRSGLVQVDADLDVAGAHPGGAQLVVSRDGSLRALWVDNPRMPRALFLAEFGRDGTMLSDPTLLSTEQVRVSDYDVAHNADGTLDVFWATESPTEGGIYYLRLSEEGRVIRGNQLLVANGAKPTLQIANDGMIHLAWVEGPTVQENNIYYAVFNPLRGQLGPKTRVGFFRTGTGIISYSPVLGLDAETAYVLWALEARGGFGAGEAQTFVVSFPLNQPAIEEALTIDIPGAAQPGYLAAAGGLPYKRLASTDSGVPTSYLYMPSVLDGQREELGVFLSGQFATRSRSRVQVVWAVFAGGKCKGYQLPNRVDSAVRPTGVIDALGNAHLAWLNAAGFGRYEVYHASTSASVMANLDRVTAQDRAMDLLNALWSLAPAIGFFPPILLLWSFASFLWVVGFYVVKVEGGLERRSAQIALVIAIMVYVFCKLFLMPAVLFFAPFADRFPANLQFVPVIATPILTALAGLGAMWLYFRRREYRSLFAAYSIFLLTDVLLSLIVYVPNWIGG